METDLIGVVFNCWKKKENPYLLSIIEEYSKTEGQPCTDGDITIWITRPASTPKEKLLTIKQVSSNIEKEEAEILNHLCSDANGLTWFNNACQGWASAKGNEGKTDTSCVLVGNVLGCIHLLLFLTLTRFWHQPYCILYLYLDTVFGEYLKSICI